MSWLGGLNDSFNQLSSLTGQLGGQISNFTKEVLTEGADEAIDYEVETHKLRQQLKQNEMVLQECEALAKQLQQENSVLKNKLHTAELNLSTTGIEYESRLQQLNKEISQYREQLLRYDDGQIDVHRRTVLPSTFSSISLNNDDDFHDVISYQRQINHLARELDESRAECEKWKRKAESTRAPAHAGSRHATEEDSGTLIARVKELETALHREADHHEQENRTMQDAHMATISRYQEEIRKLKQNLVSSPAESSFNDSQSSSVSDDDKIRSHRQDLEKLKSEMDVLKEQLRTKTRQLQLQKKRIDELTTACKEIEDKKNSTKNLLISLRSSIQIKEDQLTDAIRKKDKLMESIMSGVQEFSKLSDIQSELMNETNVLSILTEIKDRYFHLVKDKEQLSAEKLRNQAEIYRLVEKVNELQETADRRRFEAENQDEKAERGEMYDMELAESDQWHEDRMNQKAEDDQDMEDDFVAESDQHKRKPFLPRHLNLGQPLSHSSPQAQQVHTSRRLREDEDDLMEEAVHEEVTLPGDLTLTLQALQKQVEDYELEIKQYEQVQSEWQHEKQSLQELLNRYQSEIVQADHQAITSKEPEDERAVAITRLRKELEELQDVRENLEKEKIRLVQEKEQLQVAAKNLEDELNSSISETQTQQGQVDNLECEIEKYADEKRRLQAAFDNLRQELNSSRMEKNELDKALDTLDSQHQDEMNQLLVVRDELKTQLANAKSEIKETKTEKDGLAEKLKTLQAQMEKISSSTNKLENLRISSMEEEMTESNMTRLKLETELAQVRKDLERLRQEQEKALLENEEVKLKVDEMEMEKNEIQEENRRLMDEDVNRRRQVEELNNQCHGLGKELAEVKKSFEDLKTSETKLQEANLRIEELEKDFKNKENHEDKLLCLQKQLDEERSSRKIEKESLQQSDKELKESLAKKDELVHQLLKEKEFLLKLEEQEDILAAHVKKLETDLESQKAELEEKQNHMEKIRAEKENFEKSAALEARHIQEENESLCLELENAGKEMAQAQSEHNDALKKLKQANQEEIREVEKEFVRRLAETEEQHRNYKIDAEISNKVYVDKVNHLEKENKGLMKKLEDTENSKTTEDQKKFFEINQSWEVKFNKSQEEHSEITKILKEQTSKLSEQIKKVSIENDQLKSKFQNELSSLETKLKQEQESKTQLQKSLHKFQDSKTSEIAVLQTELNNAKLQISTLNVKLSAQQNQSSKFSNEFDSGKSEEQNQQQKDEYELKISELKKEIEVLKKSLTKHELTSGFTAEMDVDKMLEQIRSLDIGDLEKSDLSKDDIGSLLCLIKERDEVISLLTQQRSAATHNTTASVEAIKQLEDANRVLITEKDQILSVISEKTKENRKLKDESHKMMNVVAEARAALTKVQQENAELVAKYEGYDREMTKEAVEKLSRLIREKELEIESLQQKCGTLLEVLQQQSPGGDSKSCDVTLTGQQVQGLLKDKETLMGQVQQLLNERNHLVALVNQKQAETEKVRVELLQAAEALERDADNNSKLQINFGNLVHDYEQTQMKLTSVQKELSFFKEKLNHLEETKEILLTKVETIEPHQSVRKLAEDRIQKASDLPLSGEQKGLQHELHKKSEALYQKDILLQKASEEKAKYESEHKKLLNDMKEKDLLIHSRTEQMNHAKRDLASKSNEVEILRKSVENLREQVSGLDRSSREAREEVRSIASRLSEKESESQAFQETNAQLSMLLKEKEYEVEEAKDKCRRLEAVTLQKEQGQESESQRLLVQLDDAKQCLIAAKHERDQVMLSLKQKKMEADKCSEEARLLRDKEVKLESELARLRNHLIQVEEAYTQEAMLAEDREKSLQEQLEQTRSTNSAVREATEQSQQQAESLQEQLRTAISQRDQAIQQYHLAQEQSIQYANALQKLQVAVEQMQREETAAFAEQMEKIKQQLEQKANLVIVLESQMEDMKAKLENANEALESASRLNKQLELKEENIENLKSIVAEKQLQVDDIQDRIHKVTSTYEGMVDKEIVKNLVIGYFTAPSNKRDDILRLITGVLEFSSMDKDRLKSGSQGGKKGWISGWIWGAGKPQQQGANTSSSSPKDASNESFTQMFIKFLENESNPHQAARLPMETMINEAKLKTHQRRTPGSPGFSAVPTPVGTTASERAAPLIAGRYSPFLLTNTLASTPVQAQMNAGVTNHPLMMQPITPILPTFAPITNPKPSAEREILQDILYSTGER